MSMESVTLVNLVPPLRSDKTVPGGPLYIAAVLEENGCYVDFRDYQMSTYENPLDYHNIVKFLADSEDVIALGCFFNVLPFLLPTLQKVRDETPEKTMILGGPGPSSVAEKLMEAFPWIDIVVKGEGERTITELAQGVPYKDVKGIVFRSGENVVSTPPRERIHTLDEVPFPAYDKIDLTKYDQAGVITARGCPYRCTFCEVASLWGYHTEQRSVSNVMDEITLLHDRGMTDFHINDDTFVLNRKWVEQFCNQLQNDMDITWRCLGRINLMDRSLLSAMAQSGCNGIQYGVESGSEQILQKIGKQISISQIKEVVSMSVQYMEHVISTFMWGFPFETMGDFYETVYMMGVLNELGSLVKLLFLSPAPLSPLYREYKTQLQFDERFVPNVLWGIYEDKFSQEKKKEIFDLILRYPEVFSAFYYIDTPEVEKKYGILKQAGLLQR
jgi:anaerobic magnesium-protoporphyrin IX monomethyl ester cyclase